MTTKQIKNIMTVFSKMEKVKENSQKPDDALINEMYNTLSEFCKEQARRNDKKKVWIENNKDKLKESASKAMMKRYYNDSDFRAKCKEQAKQSMRKKKQLQELQELLNNTNDETDLITTEEPDTDSDSVKSIK